MTTLSIGAALLAGVLSFLSPCVLPLIPGYLSFISGCNAEEVLAGKKRLQVFMRTVFFVLGFSLVFIVLGILFSSSGLILVGSKSKYISVVAGSVIAIFGLNMIFNFLKFLNAEFKAHAQKKPVNALGSFLVGMAFGAGWTPCIGPILASILLMASQSASLAKAIVLLIVYSSGLAIPFLLAGLLFDRISPLMRWFVKRGKEIRIASGILLTGIGFLMILGKLTIFNSLVTKAGFRLQDALLQEPETVKAITLIVLGSVLALVMVIFIAFRKKNLKSLRLVALLLVSSLFIAELSGLIWVAGIISAWLLFQG